MVFHMGEASWKESSIGVEGLVFFFCTEVSFRTFNVEDTRVRLGQGSKQLSVWQLVLLLTIWQTIGPYLQNVWGVPGGAGGKEPACQCRTQETQLPSLGRDDPLQEGTTTHSSILAWRTPWTEEPGALQSVGSERVGHDRSNLARTHTCSSKCLLTRKADFVS